MFLTLVIICTKLLYRCMYVHSNNSICVCLVFKDHWVIKCLKWFKVFMLKLNGKNIEYIVFKIFPFVLVVVTNQNHFKTFLITDMFITVSKTYLQFPVIDIFVQSLKIKSKVFSWFWNFNEFKIWKAVLIFVHLKWKLDINNWYERSVLENYLVNMLIRLCDKMPEKLCCFVQREIKQRFIM